MRTVTKAYELYDAQISFVSLVGRPANKRTFLVVKSEDESAPVKLESCGRILETGQVQKSAESEEAHYVVGVVYEPLAEDSDGEFMTEVEIEKAAHWFMKYGRNVDEQHDYKPNPNCDVVESWIAHEDTEIGGQAVKKGTWLAKIEVRDVDVWDKIEKHEINGFSFAGLARVGTVDVDLSENEGGGSVMDTEKSVDQQTEKRGLLARIAKAFGLDADAEAIEKGDVRDIYERGVKADGFWRAFDALRSSLCYYNYHDDAYVYESDPEVLRDALKDFTEIITELLCAEPAEIEKAIKADGAAVIEKAGKKISAARMEKLLAAHQNLSDLVSELSDPDTKEEGGTDETEKSNANTGDGVVDKAETAEPTETEKEESDMSITPEERAALIADIVKAMKEDTAPAAAPTAEPAAEPVAAEKSEPVTREALQSMIEEAVAKATKKEEPEAVSAITQDDIQAMVDNAVAKARGVSSALNEEQRNPAPAQKSRGMFTGLL